MTINFETKIGLKDKAILYFSRSKLSFFEKRVIKRISITLESEMSFELNKQIDLCLFKQVHRIDGCTKNACYSELIFVPKVGVEGNFAKNKEDGRALLKKRAILF